MKLLKNFAKFSEGNPEPGLRFRYSKGLGDFIACFLHSKYISPITRKLTGKTKPCTKCSKRALALNMLLPIPFWKLFFDSEEEMVISLQEDLIKAGYTVKSIGPTEFSATREIQQTPPTTFTPITPTPNFTPKQITPPADSNYDLVGTTDNYIGDFKIQTLIYKHR